jgi:hypothetical protein
MRNLLLACLATLSLTCPATAFEITEREFLGVWRNIDPDSRGVTRLEIRPDRGDTVFVRVWRRCRSGECELGRASGRIFYNRSESASETDQAAILVQFNREETSGNVLVRLSPRGNIVTHALLVSRESSDNIYAVERFERARTRSFDDGDRDRRRWRH